MYSQLEGLVLFWHLSFMLRIIEVIFSLHRWNCNFSIGFNGDFPKIELRLFKSLQLEIANDGASAVAMLAVVSLGCRNTIMASPYFKTFCDYRQCCIHNEYWSEKLDSHESHSIRVRKLHEPRVKKTSQWLFSLSVMGNKKIHPSVGLLTECILSVAIKYLFPWYPPLLSIHTYKVGIRQIYFFTSDQTKHMVVMYLLYLAE